MIDLSRVGNNLITLLILGGLGYVIWLKVKGADTDSRFLKKFFVRGKLK